MVNNKTRKRTGRVEARLIKPTKMKYKEVLREGIEPVKYWDDWKDKKRDGMRSILPKDQKYHDKVHCFKSKEEIIKHNEKIDKLNLIRRRRSFRMVF